MPSELTLTSRQYEVLALLAQGMTAVEIGEALHITPRTARAHTEVLRAKLAVSRARDVPFAFRCLTGQDPLERGPAAWVRARE
jgi:DNA-binding CsgD family transcriptional regulator